jgi:uncharacterized Zn-finger protein
MQDENKAVLSAQLITQAYAHPKFAQLRFQGAVVCPSCHAELAHVLQDNETNRLLACMNCGTRYKEKDMAA